MRGSRTQTTNPGELPFVDCHVPEPAPDATVYPLAIQEGEKTVLNKPITVPEMYRIKMSKDLEPARFKKLFKEKQLQEPELEKAKLEANMFHENLKKKKTHF